MGKFLYKYDIDKYLDEAYKKVFDLYPWATKDMLDNRYKYAIEKEGKHYEFIEYYSQDGKEYRRVLDWIKDTKGFLDYIKNNCENHFCWVNPIKETYKPPIEYEKMVSGWYLERYEFNKLLYGGYSVFVQAGDRTTGGSRTFLIPQYFFNGTYYEFLDKYFELVPAYFGMGRKELETNKELVKFLGFGEKE